MPRPVLTTDVTQLEQRQIQKPGDTAHQQRNAWLALTLTALALLLPGQVVATMLAFVEPALDILRQWKDSWWPWLDANPEESGIAPDKIIHVILFAVCAVLACKAWLSTLNTILIILLLIIFAGLTEFFQYFVPGRSMSMGDMLADTLGILAGALIWQGRHRYRTRFTAKA
jgi:VanZ family protein